MKFVLDSHTHTVASGHAYSTLAEMVRTAADRGLELLCVTDHAPAMPGSTCEDYFNNLRVVDRELFGIQLMMGVELNLLDCEGSVDLRDKTLRRTDLAILSLHPRCLEKGGSREAYTAGILKALENPLINIVGHPDDGRFPLDYPALVRAAGEGGVALEVNNTSLSPGCGRQNSRENCTEMLRLCKKEGVCVVVGSDAHFFTSVGRHEAAQALLEELDFPPELVLNRDAVVFRDFLQKRRARDIIAP